MLSFDDLQKIKKDICFLYHEQAVARFNNPRASFLDSDLAYSTCYKNNYIEALNTVFDIEVVGGDAQQYVDDDYFDLTFVANGCVVFILLMALESVEQFGSTISQLYEESKSVLAKSKKTSASQSLVSAASYVLNLVGKETLSEKELSEIEKIKNKVYCSVILDYFKMMKV